MKILTLTAHFPPYHFGGYGLRVKNIMDGLSARGHTILVMTNCVERRFDQPVGSEKYPVDRGMHLRTRAKFFPKEMLFDLLDTRLLRQQITRFKPDLIYLGHMYVFSKAILPYLARQEIPIVYDEGGSGLIEAWTEHGRWFRFTGDYRSRFAPLNWIKPLVVCLVVAISRGRIQREWTWPQNMRIIFNSELNRKNSRAAGVPIDNSTVIHSGVDTSVFTFKPREKIGSPLRIIVPGRIERRKGQLDAVRLVKSLLDEGIDTQIVMAGATADEEYLKLLREEIQKNQIAQNIKILPMLTQKELVEHYHESDICFFPSYQEVGFSRTPLEAMACGCIVISYGNEGSIEIIQHMKTGCIFPTKAMAPIVGLIKRLIEDSIFSSQIQLHARATIDNLYTINNYLDVIENYIIQPVED